MMGLERFDKIVWVCGALNSLKQKLNFGEVKRKEKNFILESCDLRV